MTWLVMCSHERGEPNFSRFSRRAVLIPMIRSAIPWRKNTSYNCWIVQIIDFKRYWTNFQVMHRESIWHRSILTDFNSNVLKKGFHENNETSNWIKDKFMNPWKCISIFSFSPSFSRPLSNIRNHIGPKKHC